MQLLTEAEFKEILRAKNGRLFRRESQTLEFKEQYNLAALADYFRDFAAFANNKGGLLVFGITDAPRVATGMSKKAADAFEKTDPEKITGFLLEIFSSNITWGQATYVVEDKTFGVFQVAETKSKPVIARRNEGKDQLIKNGDIYFRYGGRTQKILSAELESIINTRIEHSNQAWLDHVKSIGVGGPSEAIILKSEDVLTNSSNAPLVVDKTLAQKLKFIKEGEFDEKKGAVSLKVVGDVVPIDTLEIEKVVKENLTNSYPLSANELASEVKKKLPELSVSTVWKAIAENELKGNPNYSVYNFRNKKQEDKYKTTGAVSSTTPVIYNQAAVEFIVKLFSV